MARWLIGLTNLDKIFKKIQNICKMNNTVQEKFLAVRRFVSFPTHLSNYQSYKRD